MMPHNCCAGKECQLHDTSFGNDNMYTRRAVPGQRWLVCQNPYLQVSYTKADLLHSGAQRARQGGNSEQDQGAGEASQGSLRVQGVTLKLILKAGDKAGRGPTGVQHVVAGSVSQEHCKHWNKQLFLDNTPAAKQQQPLAAN